ncbi:MAG TPA: U32 family peptidase, partial [Gemmatimonadaceae bacterium]|nr:U32 family peptidase [Gemmatimonadaceae bacterium]
MSHRNVPELLAPAGSVDAVRAAVANGANAVYMGAARFNARDEGAQLSLDELDEAVRIAHQRGVRVYLTLNVLVKPAELRDALRFLGEAVDRGIDAVIVQDIGLVRLIRAVYHELEIHGSTQMTVHDAAGAAVMRDLGVERVVLARENSIEDVRAIRAAVPDVGLETFVHGALCISYSGQCYMSGMISERSANRGSCAQSCRKDYVLTDPATGEELDRGYLISARDLGAWEHLPEIAEAGVGCLKVEGRKKKPEYVATVTRTYRGLLDQLERGEWAPPTEDDVQPLVQIFSRGFTGGMYGGRAGRAYITRSQPDNYGAVLGAVVDRQGGELIVELSRPVVVGDGLGFEPAGDAPGRTSTGFQVTAVRTLVERDGMVRQAIQSRTAIPVGWRVVRSSSAELLERARSSYAALPAQAQARKTRLDVRLFGAPGAPLKAVFTADGDTVTVRSEVTLAPAQKRALSRDVLREQLGRLGETPFALAALDDAALAPDLFLPLSELNRLRQQAVDELMMRRDWSEQARLAEREAAIETAVAEIEPVRSSSATATVRAAHDVAAHDVAADAPAIDAPLSQGVDAAVRFTLSADVHRLEDARAAADAGATELVFDPFLRNPIPPAARLRALAEEMAERGVSVRLRTPTVVRPVERHALDKWLALGLPVTSGHLGLVVELARAGRDVAADYAVNCFNQHTAAEYFRLGARRITLSVELTADEMREVAEPWGGQGFDVVVYGRPEGMTIEHCVLSAAYDRVPTTCRDLCVKKHPEVELTDPAGYTFPVALDTNCRNRLLHSRPVDGSEYLPRLWRAGL